MEARAPILCWASSLLVQRQVGSRAGWQRPSGWQPPSQGWAWSEVWWALVSYLSPWNGRCRKLSSPSTLTSPLLSLIHPHLVHTLIHTLIHSYSHMNMYLHTHLPSQIGMHIPCKNAYILVHGHAIHTHRLPQTHTHRLTHNLTLTPRHIQPTHSHTRAHV